MYHGTLGYKVNHNFHSQVKLTLTDTARYVLLVSLAIKTYKNLVVYWEQLRNILFQKYFRFGLILCYRTIAPIKKGEEIFFDYNYPLKLAPKWYRDHYLKFQKEKLSKGNDKV